MAETKQELIGKLNELIKDIKIAMLTTNDAGVFRSRPMATQEAEFNGELWFFTSKLTHKAEEIAKDDRVNVSYAEPADNRYISMSGTAEMVDDRAKIEELWSPAYHAWFPKGLDDPNIILLKITVEQAEYWDATSSSLVEAFGLLKALVTGEQAGGGDHAMVSLA
jgi:general stress protein 26